MTEMSSFLFSRTDLFRWSTRCPLSSLAFSPRSTLGEYRFRIHSPFSECFRPSSPVRVNASPSFPPFHASLPRSTRASAVLAAPLEVTEVLHVSPTITYFPVLRLLPSFSLNAISTLPQAVSSSDKNKRALVVF